MLKNRWFGLFMFFWCLGVSAEIDFLIFPEVGVSLTDKTRPDTGKVEIDINPGADFFVTGRWRQFNLLAEFFVDKEEADFERLQLGWSFDQDTTLSLGRVHNFLGYWNTAFHHGSFLETTIDRPAPVRFEDDGGMLPIHITGLMLQTGHRLEQGRLNYDFAFGLAPKLGRGKLEAFKIVDPRASEHDLGGSVRISYHPSELSTNELGIFAGAAIFDSDALEFNKILQYQFGVYTNWEIEKLRIIGSVFYLPSRIERVSGNSHDELVSGYLQSEYMIDDTWRVYARYERSGLADELRDVFPDLVKENGFAGIRVDIGLQNAIKLEIGHRRLFKESNLLVQIEWSAVFP